MRNLRFQDLIGISSCSFVSIETENTAVLLHVRLASGKVVEGDLSSLDNVAGDKGGAFGRTLLRALDAALPLQYSPAVVPRLGE